MGECRWNRRNCVRDGDYISMTLLLCQQISIFRFASNSIASKPNQSNGLFAQIESDEIHTFRVELQLWRVPDARVPGMTRAMVSQFMAGHHIVTVWAERLCVSKSKRHVKCIKKIETTAYEIAYFSVRCTAWTYSYDGGLAEIE